MRRIRLSRPRGGARVPAALTAVLASAAATLVLAASPALAYTSPTYHVLNTRVGLTVRVNATDPNAQVVRTLPDGTGWTADCAVRARAVGNGNPVWHHITSPVVGYLADYWTDTPGAGGPNQQFLPGEPTCGAAQPTPPTATSTSTSTAATPQMRLAVAWALAEKNSPDPTWSDHYHHAWSGWCEQFVEQAENFTFRFPTALADFAWQRDHGRLHTGGTPPAGALVFYGGGSAGHVAVSIGGGQAVGTYGFVGQRLAVRQYPVVGFLTNPYLGWSTPIGS
ncbi:SH3b domain-containing protein [Frankia sp. AiPs1]|uniref:hypothetical protein n=1 Tax=Frankia sp. AiPa1 TaxID=573492 RepID=UPI00202B4EA0|nr:hypothetical protein [Frankia sp. AiPa1]MCL9758680.1 hypothetical protein [Frankia sp. AiPa1]